MLKIVQIVTININELTSSKFAFHHCRPEKKKEVSFWELLITID